MATYTDFALSGVTNKTPENIVLGAGALYRDGKFTDSSFTGTLLGATSGGVTVTITPEFYDVEADGVMVKAAGLSHKVGETAQLTTNLIEVTDELLKMAVIGENGTSEDATRFNKVDSKAHVETGDYIKGLTYVGYKVDGSPIIVMFDKALCTSGLELATANKENTAIPVTFECYADLATGLTNKLPYHIYTPKATA